jgi:ferredoxin
MRIIVDRDLCEANAVCVTKAPEVFVVDEESRMVLLQERPQREVLGQVQQAVYRCPRGALSLVDD